MTFKPYRALFAGLFLLLTMLVVGCSGDAPPVAGEAPKVSVMHPEQREISNYIEFNGWMQPDRTQEVRARVRGHIKKVYFKDGQLVKKGDPLFDIDPRPFQAALDAATARVARADAALKLAKSEAARVSFLATSGAASREEREVAVAKEAVANADKLVAQRDVEQAKLDLEYAKITADQDGRISKAELTEGNLVNAGGSNPLLTTIVSTDPIRVYFNVDERSIQRYARDVKAAGKNMTEILANLKDVKTNFTFQLEGETGFKHQGTLAFSDNQIDRTTGTMQLYATVPNKEGFFVAGARVRVRLSVGKPGPALLVPETAILSDQDKRYLLIADDKNDARRRNVTLGVLTDDGLRAIRPEDKLPEGEKPEAWWVIVDNLQRVRVNYAIDPQKPAPATAADKPAS